MINVTPAVQAFARPFTEINDHPIIWQDPAGGLADDEITRRMLQKINREISNLTSGETHDVNISTIYSFFESCQFVCPNCSELLDGLDYSSDVREYGSVSLYVGGADDYKSYDSDTQSTEFSCPECNEPVNESTIAILCSRGGVQVINNFITTLLEGRYGTVGVTSPSQEARHAFYANPSMAGVQAIFRPGALTGAGMATQCDASVPIATEDIIMADQDLFDN